MAAETIRYMLTRRQPFTPAGATTPLGASPPLPDMRDRSETPFEPDAYEEANRLDVQALLSFFAPDGVCDMSPTGMGTSEGTSAIGQFLEGWWGAYDGYRIEAEEIVDLGNGVIFSTVNQGGRPAGSAGCVALRYGSVASWRNGLIERVTNYSDIDEARAAAEQLAQERW